MPTPELRAHIRSGTIEQDQARQFLRRASFTAAFLLIAMIVSMSIAQRARTARTALAVTYGEVGRVARDAEMAAIDRETAIRGFLLTGDSASLEPELRGRVKLRFALDTLDSVVANAPPLRARVAIIREAIAQWEAQFAEPVLRGERRPTPDSTLAGKPAFDEIRRRFDAFIGDEDARYLEDAARYDASSREIVAAILLELGLFIALAFLMRARLRRQIDRVTEQHDVLVQQNSHLREQQAQMEAQTLELEITLQEAQDAESILRRTTERLADAQRIAQIGTCEVELDTGETVWSEEMYRILELPPTSTVRGLDVFLEHVVPADRERVERETERAMQHGTAFMTEYRLTKSDGSVMTVAGRGAVTRDESGRRVFVGTVQDITERQRAEDALRQANELLHTFLQSSPVAVVATDLELRVLVWNQAAEQLFGWTADEVIGRPSPLITPEFGAESAKFRESALRDGTLIGVKSRRPRKDGVVVDISISVAAYRDARGTPAGFMVIISDLTERLKLEAQLRQSQKMEAVGRLAGGISHDFNNLLTVIISYTDMLRATSQPSRSDFAPLGEIRDAADRAAALTRQLLAFSRQQVLRPHVLDLNDVIERLQKMLVRLVGEDVLIRSNLDRSLGAVSADPGQIEQVLVNLAVNARDAMPHGGTLTIETTVVTVDSAFIRQHPTITRPGRYAAITVSDTGTGMPPDVRERIFEPFFSTKEQSKGTGLGLSTVHGIVEQSGGHIFVYSEIGFGTTFKIYLPEHDSPAEPMPAAVAPAATLGGDESILLVEDDEAVRRVAATILRRAGYTIIEADNGAAALRACDQPDSRIDLVITDVVMPTMGGRDLSREIRSRRPGMRMIFMSGYTRSMLTNEDMTTNAAFVEKPFSADDLLQTVRDLLDGVTRPSVRSHP